MIAAIVDIFALCAHTAQNGQKIDRLQTALLQALP